MTRIRIIKKHINLSYSFNGSIQHVERWQYPLETLRELLLNSMVHRDYKNLSDIVIKIFNDRIIFTNPGRLYGKLTPCGYKFRTSRRAAQLSFIPQGHKFRLSRQAAQLSFSLADLEHRLTAAGQQWLKCQKGRE